MAVIKGEVLDLNPERVPFHTNCFQDRLKHLFAALGGGPPLSMTQNALVCQHVINAT